MKKRFLFIALGSLVGVALAHISTLIIGKFFGPLYASEDDMQRNVLIYFVAMVFTALFGGWLGSRLASKNA